MIEYMPSNKCRVDLMIRKRKNLFNLKYMYIFLAFLSLSFYKRTWKNKTDFFGISNYDYDFHAPIILSLKSVSKYFKKNYNVANESSNMIHERTKLLTPRDLTRGKDTTR